MYNHVAYLYICLFIYLSENILLEIENKVRHYTVKSSVKFNLMWIAFASIKYYISLFYAKIAIISCQFNICKCQIQLF